MMQTNGTQGRREKHKIDEDGVGNTCTFGQEEMTYILKEF